MIRRLTPLVLALPLAASFTIPVLGTDWPGWRGPHRNGSFPDLQIPEAVDVATAEERWRRRGFGKGFLLRTGDRILILGETGQLALIEATPEEYRELAHGRLFDHRSWTPPSFADGVLYARTGEEIVAVELGTEPWPRERS